MNKLVGRTAIVTGGANGIGRGIAEAFASEGADVAIADIAPNDKAALVIEAIQQAGRKALYIRTDVAEEQQVRSMVEAVYSAFGHIDILVNNAGIFTQALVLQSQLEQKGGRMLQGGEADDHRRRGRTSQQSRREGTEHQQSECAGPG
ncbi:MAG TPA: SDR family NAD(P)-dependent oxidoreductase [Ktedonobacteraceae bacterium]